MTARAQTTGAEPSSLAASGGYRLLRVDGRAAIAGDAGDPVAMRRLSTLTEAHRSVALPIAARVENLELRDGAPIVTFEAGAAMTLEAVLRRLELRKLRFAYADGLALVQQMLELLVHLEERKTDPITLGALAPRSFVVAPDGAVHLVGLGDNVLLLDDGGRPRAVPGLSTAPEVGVGARPTPGSDLCALTFFTRNMIGFVEFPPRAERILAGGRAAEDDELAQLFAWSTLAILASHPDRRPTARQALDNAERAWGILGVTPDADGYRRFLARCAEDPARDALVLELSPDGDEVRMPSGDRVAVGRRRPLQRILFALARAHAAGPRPLTRSELIEAGWPGERLRADAAASRVYVALNELRKLGLEQALDRYDGGWRISPWTEVRWGRLHALPG